MLAEVKEIDLTKRGEANVIKWASLSVNGPLCFVYHSFLASPLFSSSFVNCFQGLFFFPQLFCSGFLCVAFLSVSFLFRGVFNLRNLFL